MQYLNRSHDDSVEDIADVTAEQIDGVRTMSVGDTTPSGWTKLADGPDVYERISPSGIRVTERRQPDAPLEQRWHTLREYPDGRRYEATDRARRAATKATQRAANR